MITVGLKVAPGSCGKTTLGFYKSKSYLIFCTSIGVHKKPSPRLSTNLYDQVCFSCRDQIMQIILEKQVNIHVYSIEIRYLPLMSIVNPLHARVY